MKFLYFLFFIVMFTSCAPSFFPNVNTKNIPQDGPYIVPEWRILGPIDIKTIDKKQKLFIDTFESVKSLYTRQYKPILKKSALPARLVNKRIRVDNDHLQFYNLFPKADITSRLYAYAGCTIISPCRQTVVLLLCSDGEFTVWLNEKEIKSSVQKRKMRCYQSFVPLNLELGANELVVKIGNNGPYWRFAGHLSTLKLGRKYYRIWSISGFLEKSILSPGQPVLLMPGPYKGSEGKIIVYDSNQRQVFQNYYDLNDSCRFSAPQKSGLYRCCFYCLSDTFQQQFYIGNPDSFYADRNYCLQDYFPHKLKALHPYFVRFEHLLKPENRENTRVWQKKIVYLIERIEKIVDDPSESDNLSTIQTGTMLRNYISPIDSSSQHYMLHIPPAAVRSSKALPLLIIMPYDAIDSLPFLKNLVVADIEMTERWAVAADQHRFAVLWPNCRGNSQGTPIEYADVFQVLEDVQQNFSIDKNRIYLLGVCKGAVRALLFAERFPSLFAGLALFAPRVTHEENPWALARPLDYLPNLIHIPVYICHSEADEVVPVRESKIFLRQARKHGLQVNFNLLKRRTHFGYPDELLLNAFRYLSDSRRNPGFFRFITNQLTYNSAYWMSILCMGDVGKITVELRQDTLTIDSQNIQKIRIHWEKLPRSADHVVWNGVPMESRCDSILFLGEKGNLPRFNPCTEGPLFHAFAKRFIVVYGTLGVQATDKILFAVAKEFQQNWYRTFFVSCRLKSDAEISRLDMASDNLILVGDRDTNSLIHDLGNRLPVNVGTGGIQICSRFFPGNHLGFLAAFANPEYPRNYIVLLSANDLSLLQVFEAKPAYHGDYDYKIWKLRKGSRPFPMGEYRFTTSERVQYFSTLQSSE
ncbi:hypothetical protein JW935_04670 [candidate division KSB1 bacterium]|nr:hypothetical protein [candidate division KSB1 bacterium]